jgi:vancomycin resistance protein YoaR
VSAAARLRAFIGPLDGYFLARIALFVVAGGIIAFILMPGPPKRQPAAAIKATIDGQGLSLDGEEAEALDAAKEIVRSYLAGKVTVKAAGGSRTRTREELGAVIDGDRLTALVKAARSGESALRRRAVADQPLALPMPVKLDAASALFALLQIKDELDRPPTEARLDLASRKVSPDEPGRLVDVYATMARLDTAFARGDDVVEADVETVQAEKTTEQLQGIVIDDVLGYFETKYARDLRHDARTFNLRLAASKLNGYVLMPGQVFDFNAVVGPRTEAMGYRVAPVIAQGELVDGIGGGTCQVAGTLHGAAFFAGLEILDRRPHTRPSFYIKMGLDAAVAYPTINLKLRNPYPYPVVLHETVQGGVVRAEILGPKRTREVSFVRRIEEASPFPEKEVTDPKIPKGARVLKQRGIPGFKVTRWRIVRDGSFAVRERWNDSYPPTVQIWQVGTGEPVKDFKAKDDEHPEYVADEFLQITQGPGIKDPKAPKVVEKPPPGAPPQPAVQKGGGMSESRIAGRYGLYGWTVKEGYTKDLHGTGNKDCGDKCESKPGVD